MVQDMVLELKYGQTEPSTKVSGGSIRLTVRENSGMLMATSMKDFGKMTKQMDSVSMSM